MYFDSKNLPRFGMKISENLIFASNTYNMYIKWKLKSYWIQIWQKKIIFLEKIWKNRKKNFFWIENFWKKKFQMRIFQKTFFTNPIFFCQPILKTKKLIYIEVWYSLVRPAEDGKLPNTARLDSTPPAHLGLKHSTLCLNHYSLARRRISQILSYSDIDALMRL